MIKRIVKLTFRTEEVPAFLAIFEESKEKIKAFPGCQRLELLRSTTQPAMMFTFSQWENEEALEAYRNSDLFKATWKKTKALFAEKPEAWSVEDLE